MFPSVACYSIDSGGLVTPIAERKFWNLGLGNVFVNMSAN